MRIRPVFTAIFAVDPKQAHGNLAKGRFMAATLAMVAAVLVFTESHQASILHPPDADRVRRRREWVFPKQRPHNLPRCASVLGPNCLRMIIQGVRIPPQIVRNHPFVFADTNQARMVGIQRGMPVDQAVFNRRIHDNLNTRRRSFESLSHHLKLLPGDLTMHGKAA